MFRNSIKPLHCQSGKDLKKNRVTCESFTSTSSEKRERVQVGSGRSLMAFGTKNSFKAETAKVRLVDGAMEDGSDLAHFVSEGDKFFGEK
jgi:hypothetical protein